MGLLLLYSSKSSVAIRAPEVNILSSICFVPVVHNPKSLQMTGWSASSANGLHQLMDSHANDLISSHQLQTQQYPVPQQPEQQPHQMVDDELMDQY
jgi:hypothetical protein